MRPAQCTVRLEGVHHVTLITGDAPRNVDFYTRVLGLRMVKKTVNQDDPTVYHLFYADEKGSAGSDITFFEYPGAARGRAGPGMVHTIVWRVGSTDALDFWEQRLRGEAQNVVRADEGLAFEDPEGVGTSCASPRRTTSRSSPSIPRFRRSTRSRASTACGPTRSTPSGAARCSRRRSASSRAATNTWEARGDKRGGFYAYDPAPEGRGIPGAGTVHHVAWATTMDEHEAWQQRVAEAGMRADARDRPLLLQVDLLPRAERDPLRARDARPRLRDRRGPRAPRRAALAAARRSSTCASRSSPMLTPLPNPRG